MLTQFHKAVLAVLGIGFLAVALAVFARGAVAGAPTTIIMPPQSVVSGILTSGEGRISLRPDIAYLSVGATEQAATAAEAQALLAARMARVLERARALGIAERDIKHSGYSIGPVYSWNERDGQPRIVGYQASQNITVTLRDVDRVGAALDELVQNDGATSASITLAVADAKAAQAMARAQAIEEARAKAEAMASAAGVRVGRAISISDQSDSGIYYEKTFARDVAASAPSEIPVGELEIVVRVTVQFGIE